MNLRILLMIFGALMVLITLNLIRKSKLSIKYSLIWFLSGLLIILVGAIPKQIGILVNFIGFSATSSFVIGVFLTLLLVISLILTLIVTKQKSKIDLLIQEISLLKKEVKDLNANRKE